MQIKQARYQRMQFTAVSLSLTQGLRRRMHELVSQPVRKLVEHRRRIIAFGQQFERMLHFMTPRALGAIAQRANHWYGLTRLQPEQKTIDARRHDRLSLIYRRLPRLNARLDYLRQIIDGL